MGVVGTELTLELRKFVAPEFVFGQGARNLAVQYSRNLGLRKILVVSDPGVIAAGWGDQLARALAEADIPFALFTDVTADPKSTEVMAGLRVYERERCDGIVVVGGGSPIDCAKGIGIVAANGGGILQYQGIDQVEQAIPPLICIPTTGGTSADVSQFAIITNAISHVKTGIVSKAIVPDISLIDPETLVTMTSELTAGTGLDALCHAFEAYVSNASSPLTDLLAIESIKLLSQNLVASLQNPNDLNFRASVMMASLEAGLAFSNAGLGLVHAMAHAAGGTVSIAHGVCNAILLPYVVEYNFEAAPEKYRSITEAMGQDVEGQYPAAVQKKLGATLRQLLRDLAVTQKLRDFGVRRTMIESMAENALMDACLATNPRILEEGDIERIYEEAL